MVKGKWFPQGSEISEAVTIRQAVFGRGQDALDQLAQQVAVYEEELPVGAARLWWAEGVFHLGDVGVLAEKRGQGFGDLLVRLLLFKALAHGARAVALQSPADMVPFFTRYGFQSRQAPQAGESLVTMEILAKDIALDNCQSQCGGDCARCGQA